MWNLIKKIIKQNKLTFKIGRCVLDYYESIKGTRYSRELQHKVLSREISLKKAINNIQERWPHLGNEIENESEKAPIFILSAGWRSGSTLMQRLIMSKERVLMWGEPYNHAGLIDKLSAPIKAFADAKWPPEQFFLSNYDSDNLSTLWVANLFPDVKYLRQAGRAFISTLLKQPAMEIGFDYWGMKEVRLTIDHAHYLKWLYPNAKFIFMFRNPYKTYMSYRPCRDWYHTWPDQPVFTPKDFAKHWVTLAAGYVNGYQEVGGILVKYEDLINGRFDISRLKEYLSMDIDTKILTTKIGSSNVKSNEIPKFEFLQIKKIVEPLASSLGYHFKDI